MKNNLQSQKFEEIAQLQKEWLQYEKFVFDVNLPPERRQEMAQKADTLRRQFKRAVGSLKGDSLPDLPRWRRKRNNSRTGAEAPTFVLWDVEPRIGIGPHQHPCRK